MGVVGQNGEVASPSCSADLAFRGLIHQVTDEAVLAKLDAGGVTAYSGFDPTASSLHVGNLLQLCTLRRLQLSGNRPIALAGGGTGLIGDPGGKASERPLLTEEQLAENLAGISGQLARFIDLEGEGGNGLLLDNAVWLREQRLIDFLRDVGKHFTVGQMVAKESVKSRIDRPEQGISYTEFTYMLLQAYDFLHLFREQDCTLQVGGSDQWGNITMGVELVRKVASAQVFGLTSPLVTKSDGSKFGKSEAGNERIWLDASLTSPYRLYQFFLNAEDASVGTYLRYFTFLQHEEIEALDAATAEAPQRREAQRALAAAVVELVHGPEALDRALRATGALFSTELADLDEATLLDVIADAPSTEVSREQLAGGLNVVDLCVSAGICSSKGEARRAVEQGGISVNNAKVASPEQAVSSVDLLHGRYLLLRRGRKAVAVVDAR